MNKVTNQQIDKNYNGLESFFTNKTSVDNKKYESLLEDLRSHDLLGGTGDNGNDLFDFNSFMYNLNNNEFKFSFLQTDNNKEMKHKRPPPGFTAPISVQNKDLEWEYAQEELNNLKKDLTMKVKNSNNKNNISFNSFLSSYSPNTNYLDLNEQTEQNNNEIEESHLVNFKSLGMDDDDILVKSPPSKEKPNNQINKVVANREPPGLEKQNVPKPKSNYRNEEQSSIQAPIEQIQFTPKDSITKNNNNMSVPLPAENKLSTTTKNVTKNHTKFMTDKDIQFVVQQQMKQIRLRDPFSDDYYYYNYNQRKERLGLPTTSSDVNNKVNPKIYHVRDPIPSLELQPAKISNPEDKQRATKARRWENDNQVLGRTDKGSLYRPKEVVDYKNDNKKKFFLKNDKYNWQRRINIEKGMSYLLSLQDAKHILIAKKINVLTFHSVETSSLDPILQKLRNKTIHLLHDLASIFGIMMNYDPSNHAITSGYLDFNIMKNILDVSKGKKLVYRSLPLLHPEARFLMLPELIKYMLRMNSISTTYQIESEEYECEEKLTQSIVITIMYQIPAPPAPILTKSLQYALDGQDTHTLKELLKNKLRAEILQALLQKGDTICNESDQVTKDNW